MLIDNLKDANGPLLQFDAGDWHHTHNPAPRAESVSSLPQDSPPEELTGEPADEPAEEPPEERGHRSVPTMIVDRNALYRAGLIHVLADSGFQVVADCRNLSNLPEDVLQHEGSVLLLGVGHDADAVLAELPHWREAHQKIWVIVVSERFSSDEGLAAMRAGASCYLAKDQITRDLLLRALDLVLLGVLVLSGQFVYGLASAPAPVNDPPPLLNIPKRAAAPSPEFVESLCEPTCLSGREALILSHLMRGASNKHIARDIGIAEATVKVHVKSLLRKIRVRNRTQAAMWGISHPEPTNLGDGRERTA